MIVIDASVLANALADDGDDGEAARQHIRRAGDLVAPDLIDTETVSVLRKRWLTHDLSAPRFRSAVDDLGTLPLVRYPALPLMRRAYELRATITPYDAAYVALAEILECALVTADTRLTKAAGTRCEFQVVRAP